MADIVVRVKTCKALAVRGCSMMILKDDIVVMLVYGVSS